ncbi:MAG: tryptophan halogenase [Paracoccaceae bacterium]|jgi:tryptophan halogenase
MRVLIVGGGSAGWITAANLQASLNGQGRGPVTLTLLEDPETPRIGVGEATIPTMRDMLHRFGLSEAEFLRACDGTFKHGIRFDDWSAPGSSYFHPFQRHLGPRWSGAVAEWLMSDRDTPFADLVSVQPHLIRQGLGPRTADAADFGGDIPYAYHMDAEMFADTLAQHCVSRGVRHIEGRVAEVLRDGADHVHTVVLNDGRRLQADLYVDCTGFRAVLSSGVTGAGWIDQSGHLLCDRAVTFRVPMDAAKPFAPQPFTRARALSAGWCWDIGLRSRRGRGYVYSSAHISAQAAEEELCADEGGRRAEYDMRHIKFHVGRLAEPWSGNVVAIGLSAGFLEPLESTGLYLADYAARVLAQMFPPDVTAATNSALARRHNQLVGEVHDEILDFIVAHYAVAARRDTPFWQDATDPARHTERLAHLLELWQLRPPSFADFSHRFPPFGHVNYEFVLMGSGWGPAGLVSGNRPAPQMAASVAHAKRIARDLPRHGALLQSLVGKLN